MTQLRIRTAIWAVALSLISGTTWADDPKPEGFDLERFNKGRVTIVAGGLSYSENPYLRLVGEMADLLNEEGKLRILPVMGDGPIENIRNLLFLEGVDISVLHSDILTFLRNHDSLPAAQRRLKYIAKLYDEYFHVVANREIDSIADLDGQKVVAGVTTSAGSTISAVTMFEHLDIEPQYLLGDWQTALEMVRKGEVAALVYSGPRGADFIEDLEAEDSLKLLSLPYSEELAETYQQSVFTDEDYPNLVEAGQVVTTLQFAAIMAVYDLSPKSERYQNVATFATRLFERAGEFQGPNYDSRWAEFRPSANVRGWERFAPAEKWLAQKQAGLEERQLAAAKAAAAWMEQEAQRKNAGTVVTEANPGPDAESTGLRFRVFSDYMRERGGMDAASDEELLRVFLRFVNWQAADLKESGN